jgi:uncharacterized protein involved in type VI secretion and phage assembly
MARHEADREDLIREATALRRRVELRVPGEAESGWCRPCVPYAGDGGGFAFLPEVGAGVWVAFEGGDVSYPIWVGCYWRAGEAPGGGRRGATSPDSR